MSVDKEIELNQLKYEGCICVFVENLLNSTCSSSTSWDVNDIGHTSESPYCLNFLADAPLPAHKLCLLVLTVDLRLR